MHEHSICDYTSIRKQFILPPLNLNLAIQKTDTFFETAHFKQLRNKNKNYNIVLFGDIHRDTIPTKKQRFVWDWIIGLSTNNISVRVLVEWPHNIIKTKYVTDHKINGETGPYFGEGSLFGASYAILHALSKKLQYNIIVIPIDVRNYCKHLEHALTKLEKGHSIKNRVYDAIEFILMSGSFEKIKLRPKKQHRINIYDSLLKTFHRHYLYDISMLVCKELNDNIKFTRQRLQYLALATIKTITKLDSLGTRSSVLDCVIMDMYLLSKIFVKNCITVVHAGSYHTLVCEKFIDQYINLK